MEKRCYFSTFFPILLIFVVGCGGSGGGDNKITPSQALSIPELDPSERWVFVPYAFPSGTNENGAIFSPRVSLNNEAWQPLHSGDGIFYASNANHRLEFDLGHLVIPELSTLTIQTTATLPSFSTSPLSNAVQFQRPLIKPSYLTATYFSSVGQVLIQAGNVSNKSNRLDVEGSPTDSNGVPLSWVPLVSQSQIGPSDCRLFIDPPPEGQNYIYQASVSGQGAKSSQTATQPFMVPFLPPSPVVATPQLGSIRLDWTNRSTHTTEIRILRAPGFVDNFIGVGSVATLPADSTSYTDLPPSPGYYTYQVAAIDGTQTTGGERVTSRTTETPLLRQVLLSGMEGYKVFRRPTGEFICLVGDYGDGKVRYQNADLTWTDHFLPNNFQVWCEGGALIDSMGHLHVFYTASKPSNPAATLAMHEWLDESGWHSETAGEEENYQGAQYKAYINNSDLFYLVSGNRGGNQAVSFHLLFGKSGQWLSNSMTSPGGYAEFSNSNLAACVASSGGIRIGFQSLLHSWLLTRSPDGSLSEMQIPDAPMNTDSPRSRKILGLVESPDSVLHILLGGTPYSGLPTSYSTYTPTSGWDNEETVGGFVQDSYAAFPLCVSQSGSRLVWQVNAVSYTSNPPATFLAIRDSAGWKCIGLDSSHYGIGFIGEKVWIVDHIQSWNSDIPDTYLLLYEN